MGAHEEVASLLANPADARLDPRINRITGDGFGEHDVIEIAPDGQTASARLHCTVHTETAIGPSCPLVEMAREQGGGVVRETKAVVFTNA